MGSEDKEIELAARLSSDVIDTNSGNAEDIPQLRPEARQIKVWNLKIRGIGVPQIAKALGVTETTIYADLRAIGKKYREELLDCDPVELVASNLQFLDEMERIALLEVNQSESTVTVETDPLTGKVTEKRIPDPNKGRFYQAALKARELKLKLLMETGIIPKSRVELFDKLGKFVAKGVEHEAVEVRTDDEIKASIARLMQHGRFMKAKGDEPQKALPEGPPA